MSITLFIPTKDRSSQLRILLQSIRDNLPTDEIDEILIYWAASNEEFNLGYAQLQAEKIVKATWMKESTPLNTIDTIVNNTASYILLITDDSFVYEHVPSLRPAINILDDHDDILTFSLRLGQNTTVVDYTKLDRPESNVEDLLQPHKCVDKTKRNNTPGVFTWNWKATRIPHFSHPISLDGTIIGLDDLKMLTLDAEHNNYRQWECCISDYVRRFDKNFHACFERSSVVTIPINQVVQAERLTDGVFNGISTDTLNIKYINGQVIDYHRLLKETEYCVDTPLKEFQFWFRQSRWYDWILGK